MARVVLLISDLADRHTGLTPAIADYYAEAARVCLDRHHAPPVDFEVEAVSSNDDATVDWAVTDDRTRQAWANEIDATEAGAYACALAAVEASSGLVAVRRAETKSGVDYYVAPPDVTSEDLEGLVKLEISGLDRGMGAVVAQRLREKLAQASAGDNRPAMAIVVAFRARVILLAMVEGQ